MKLTTDREVHLHVQQYLRLGKGTFDVVDVFIIVDIIDIYYFILHYILLFIFLMLSTLSIVLKFLMFLKVTALKDFQMGFRLIGYIVERKVS